MTATPGTLEVSLSTAMQLRDSTYGVHPLYRYVDVPG